MEPRFEIGSLIFPLTRQFALFRLPFTFHVLFGEDAWLTNDQGFLVAYPTSLIAGRQVPFLNGFPVAAQTRAAFFATYPTNWGGWR